MQPDAIPIEPIGSYAILTGEAIEALFGEGHQLRGTERVELVQRGKGVGIANVRLGETIALFLSGGDRLNVEQQDLRLRGPKGLFPAPDPQPIPAVLVLPDGLMGAWSLSESQQTTVVLGTVATRVTVARGTAACVRVDRSLVFAGGDADLAARWMPDVKWDNDAMESSEPDTSSKRLITENDVRRARMLRQRIRVQSGQLITPAARALADDLGVLDES